MCVNLMTTEVMQTGCAAYSAPGLRSNVAVCATESAEASFRENPRSPSTQQLHPLNRPGSNFPVFVDFDGTGKN